MFALPTATGRVLGQGKLSMGPSIIALVQLCTWTIGALVNNIWSVAGPSDRAGREPDVAAVFHQLQPEKGLVYLDVANDHGELAGIKRERLDGAGGRGSGA